MKNYELLYIISNQFTEEELKDLINQVNGLLQKYQAEIGYQEVLGKRKLAYPINKVAHGYYVVTEFTLPSGQDLQKINQDLILNKQLVRAQIIAKPKITSKEIEEQKRRANQLEYQPEPGPREMVRKEIVRAAPPKEKISMKELDEKLNEILKDDNIV